MSLQTAEKPKFRQSKLHDSACIEISANLLQSYFDDKKQAKDDRVRKTWLTAGVGVLAFLTIGILAHLSTEQGRRKDTLQQEYSRVAAQLRASGLLSKKDDVDAAVLALPATFAAANDQALNDLGAVLVSTQAGSIQLSQINLDVAENGEIKLTGSAEVREIQASRAFTDRIQSLRNDREVMVSAVRTGLSGSDSSGLLTIDFVVKSAGGSNSVPPTAQTATGVRQ